MEIRRYGQTVMRWWWVVAIVFVLAAVAGFLQTRGYAQYEAQATLVVRQIAQQPLTTTVPILNQAGQSDLYLSSEYLVDDYLEVVRGSKFAELTFDTLQQDPATYQNMTVVSQPTATAIALSSSATITRVITPDSIYTNLGATRVHRVMSLTAYADDPMKAIAIVQAAAHALVTHPSDFIQTKDQVEFSILDLPRVRDGKIVSELKSDRGKKLTNAVLTIILGLLAGIVLAFLLDYLDDRIRDSRDAQRQLGLPVISVPMKGKLP